MANQIIDVTQNGPFIPILSSASRTASPDTVEIQGVDRYTGLVVVVNVTAVASTPSMTVALLGVDRLSGATWSIVTSPAITSTGTSLLRVHPGITTSANVAVSDVLPPLTRVSVTHANSNAITYSVAAYLTN